MEHMELDHPIANGGSNSNTNINAALESNQSEEIPKDAKIMENILHSMGVDDYEPKVVNQLLEFMYRYVNEILSEAQIYSAHANKPEVDTEDLRIAIGAALFKSFTQPPPREIMLEMAQAKNAQPLPPIPQKYGVHLPPDEYCLTAPNFQLEPKRKNRDKQADSKPT